MSFFDNSIPRLVVCAAIRKNDTIICGVRHFDNIMRDIIKKCGENFGGWEQGFVDNNCVFITRDEAWIIAHNEFQIRSISTRSPLFSENLY